jgi:hypothetical protein
LTIAIEQVAKLLTEFTGYGWVQQEAGGASRYCSISMGATNGNLVITFSKIVMSFGVDGDSFDTAALATGNQG